jgi:uncharacterized protein (TIGR02145 family)
MTGDLFLFTSCRKQEMEMDKVTDIEGNSYKTVKIGDQWWMAENLKTTLYNDGSEIPLVTGILVWKGLRSSAYCWYENNISYKNDYGALYNWYVVKTGKLCPTGWHVPNNNEWSTLVTYLGGIEVASGKLKETGISHWITPNKGATNESGFTALPGGRRDYFGVFNYADTIGYWWYGNESYPDHPYSTSITYNSTFFYEDKYCEYFWGFSVRCVKD